MRHLNFSSRKTSTLICGPEDKYLRRACSLLNVDFKSQQGQIFVTGDVKDIELLEGTIRQLENLKEHGTHLQPKMLERGIGILKTDSEADLGAYFNDIILLCPGKPAVTPCTVGQRDYIATIRENDIVFGTGPAGTGKTFVAVAAAVAALKQGDIHKIIITRPAVEAGENLGFLPGDMDEKIAPYLRPILDALREMLPEKDLKRFMDDGTIEVCPLAFMRGRTFDNSYVLLDEAQNTTIEQMKMALTRLGDESKMLITGDPGQHDMAKVRGKSGLVHAMHILRNNPRIPVVKMTVLDVVRHPLVAEIIKAYEADGK